VALIEEHIVEGLLDNSGVNEVECKTNIDK
jgi:hypothetical protein